MLNLSANSAFSAVKSRGVFRFVTCVLGLILLSSVLFFYRLADRDLWSSHEARAAQDAQSMVGDGYWGIPRLFDQQLDLQKPPLYYWCVASVAWLRGTPVDAWGVRLPAALSALTLLFALFLFDWRQSGLLGAIILATAVHFTWLARIGRIDMPLALAVSAALLAFFRAGTAAASGGRQPPETWRWHLLGYVALAAAVMLKGPIGLVLPAAVMTLHLAVETWLTKRDSGAASESAGAARLAAPTSWTPLARFARSLLWGVPLLLLLVLPWFLWAARQTDGRLLRTFLWYHNIERAFGGGQLRGHPWWFYGPRLFVDFLPWSLLLPWAGWCIVRSRREPDAQTRGFVGVSLACASDSVFEEPDAQGRVCSSGVPLARMAPDAQARGFVGASLACASGSQVSTLACEPRLPRGWVPLGSRHLLADPLARFGLVWLLGMLLVLSCARFKRADYLLPAYPGLAILLGRFLWIRWEHFSKPRVRLACLTVVGMIVVGSAIGWGYFVTTVLPVSEPTRESHAFAATIRRIAPPPQLVIFFRVESHALAFHVGRPLNTVMEWENIEIWASRPGEHYFVMPPDCARDWAEHITTAELEVIATNETPAGPHEHPLVLLRTKQQGRLAATPRVCAAVR